MEEKRDEVLGADPRVSDDALRPGGRAPGIHRLAIPTPFAVGRVNCYLIEDEPLTLVDAGPNSGKALDELQRELAGARPSIEDIELVILTHQHIDHLGLVGHRGVSTRAPRSRPSTRPCRSSRTSPRTPRRDDDFARELMLRNGIPEDVVSALQLRLARASAPGARAPSVTRVLARRRDARACATASCEVLHRPGHSPTDTVF